MDEVSTPCIGICTLGPKDLCIGCFRTADEIGNWLNISSNERDRIMAELPDRLEVLFA